MEDVAIELENVSVGYGGVPVLHDVSLVARFGQVTALLGANGAGKSTTLYAITRLLALMAGTVRIDGHDVQGRSCHQIVRQGLSFVPEDRGLVSELTARDNLRLHTKERTRIEAALALFPALDPLMGRRAGLLSGGEQQMLALGCAMAKRPRILLIDELSHGLAPIVVEQLLPSVQRLAEQDGMAVVLVEQHVNAALAVASDVYVLKGGRVALSSDAASLRMNPGRLEACYLGSSALSGV